jgi:hypothetical protein
MAPGVLVCARSHCHKKRHLIKQICNRQQWSRAQGALNLSTEFHRGRASALRQNAWPGAQVYHTVLERTRVPWSLPLAHHNLRSASSQPTQCPLAHHNLRSAPSLLTTYAAPPFSSGPLKDPIVFKSTPTPPLSVFCGA